MKMALVAAMGAAVMVSGCSTYGDGYGPRSAGYNGWGAYDYNRVDPAYGGYYADRYYRDAPNYRERRLSRRDRIYAGQDGRYYCRRDDGTTGLIVGAGRGDRAGRVGRAGRADRRCRRCGGRPVGGPRPGALPLMRRMGPGRPGPYVAGISASSMARARASAGRASNRSR